jgi:plasmid stabilization system protein ParE
VFPRSGRMIAHFRRDNLREILVHRYRIIYYIRNDEEVEIIAVLHSSKQN